jgi:hypothetical protein
MGRRPAGLRWRTVMSWGRTVSHVAASPPVPEPASVQTSGPTRFWRTAASRSHGVCGIAPHAVILRRNCYGIDRRLLAIIGRRIPAIYDVIPRGPQQRFGQNRFSEVALNPQPLPPAPPEELGAAIAAEVIHIAWLANRLGLAGGIAFADLDDGCPTVPKKPKLPPWWPPVPEPDPHPKWFINFHLGFVARLAVASVEFEGAPLGESLDKAIDRSVASIKSVKTR